MCQFHKKKIFTLKPVTAVRPSLISDNFREGVITFKGLKHYRFIPSSFSPLILMAFHYIDENKMIL